MPEDRLTLEELARRGGTTPRTVRYYIAEGVVPPALGRGRGGAHYDERHLQRLRAARTLREGGVPLDRIRALLRSTNARATSASGSGDAVEVWTDPSYAPEKLREVNERWERQFAARFEDAATVAAPTPSSQWTRLELAPGLELHVSDALELPTGWDLTGFAERARRLFAADDR